MDKAGPSRRSTATDGDQPNWAIRESKTCQSRIAENSTPSLQRWPSTTGHIGGPWPSFLEQPMDPNPNHLQPSPTVNLSSLQQMLPGFDHQRSASLLPHHGVPSSASSSIFVPQQPTVDYRNNSSEIPLIAEPESQTVPDSLPNSAASSSRSLPSALSSVVPMQSVSPDLLRGSSLMKSMEPGTTAFTMRQHASQEGLATGQNSSPLVAAWKDGRQPLPPSKKRKRSDNETAVNTTFSVTVRLLEYSAPAARFPTVNYESGEMLPSEMKHLRANSLETPIDTIFEEAIKAFSSRTLIARSFHFSLADQTMLGFSEDDLHRPLLTVLSGRGIQLGSDNIVNLCLIAVRRLFEIIIQWHNFEAACASFKRVDKHDGGGSLEVICECGTHVAIVLNEAIRDYFPNGRSNSHGSFASEFNFGLADQNMMCFEEAELQLPLLQLLHARGIREEQARVNLLSKPCAEQPSGFVPRSDLPEKPPRLPFDCMLPVFQFLPTFELVRFLSKYQDPLGAYWSQALSHVLERQRIPFTLSIKQGRATSLSDTFHTRSSTDRPAWNAFLSDATGAHVATIKHPKFLARSAVAEFVEKIIFSDRVAYLLQIREPGILLDIPPPVQDLLSLENLYTLTFAGGLEASNFGAASNDRSSLERLPVEKLKSLAIKEDSFRVVCQFCSEVLLHMAQSMPLETLDVTVEVFAAALPAVVPYEQVFNNAATNEPEVFAGLLVLRLWSWNGHLESRLLWYIRTRCLQLRELSLIVNINEELWPYFCAFRALPKLNRLGLNFVAKGTRNLTGLDFLPNKLNEIQDEAEVTTVLDLRIAADFRTETQGALLNALLKKFPSTRALSIAAEPSSIIPSHLMLLLGELRLTKTLPELNSFACIAEIDRPHSPSDLLLELTNLPHLPEIVDLSDLVFRGCNAKPHFLSDLWRNMQSANQIIRLDVRCVVCRQDVQDFRETHDQRKAPDPTQRLVCWRDIKSRDLQVGQSTSSDWAYDSMNYKITGTKTIGMAKGQLFSGFIHHQSKECVGLLQKR